MKQKAISIKMWVMLALLCGFAGCSLNSSDGGDTEMIFAATEVGTPEGDKVIKDIGPAGGTLASPDGRLTLTVPQNALTETVTFAIQPITNKAGNGIGLAYRLEPRGKTFTTPLEVSVRYNDHDLEGTFAEALAVAYQDKQGAWHAQKSAKLDKAAKTLTVSATHFSDWSFISRLRMSPASATLRVGESQFIEMVECKDPGFIDKILSRPAQCASRSASVKVWKVQGEGTLEDPGAGSGVIYTAPGKKPSPNVAYVVLEYEIDQWSGNEIFTVEGILKTKITIVDRGYRATGKARDSVLSGVVCDLEKPFQVSATHPLANYVIEFVPLTSGAGAARYVLSYQMIRESGEGTYTLRSGGDGFDIVFDFDSVARTPVSSFSGKGVANIHLAPLDTDECSKK